MNNTLQAIGDTLLLSISPKIIGRVSITSYTDEFVGITENRSVKKEFRVSLEEIFWTDWKELTNENLEALDSFSSNNSLFIEVKYTREGTDETGEIVFKNIQFLGNCVQGNYPTISKSIFKNIIKSEELFNLERNLFKKLYFRGILPTYILRGENRDYKEDKDFSDLFSSVARFFALFVTFFKRWENFRNDEELLREQVRGYGLHFNEEKVVLEELQYITQNIFSQAQQRGTRMIFIRKGEMLSNNTPALVDGEFIRLTRNRICDELLYENVPKWKSGWCMNQSSPLYKGTSRSYNLNKTGENTEDFKNLSNFVLCKSGSGNYSMISSDDRKVLKLNFGSGSGRAGLGRLEGEDISDNLYSADPQIDYEITFAFKLQDASSSVSIEFGVEGFDVNKNYLNDAFVTPNGFSVSNEFFNQPTNVWRSGEWYYARGIIHAYSSLNVEQELTNLGFGTNLYFNNPFLKYILPKIQIVSSISTNVEIWDYKIRPLVRGKNIIPLKDGSFDAKSLGFVQTANLSHTYFRNNNRTQSQEEITDIIEKYLYPFNRTNLFTITGNN